MKKYNYKRKNKYNGIKMAKYEEEEKTLEEFKARAKNSLLGELSKSISEENSIIENLEKQKEEALTSGKQEDFIKVSELLKKSEFSLEYYTKRRESLKEASRVKKEEVMEIAERIRQKQDRLNRDSLKWLYEELRGTVYVLEEIERELSEGDKVLSEVLSLYRKDVPESEYKETARSIPYYEEPLDLLSYPEKSISILLSTLREHKRYLEQDSMKKWVEDQWEKEESNCSESMYS